MAVLTTFRLPELIDAFRDGDFGFRGDDGDKFRDGIQCFSGGYIGYAAVRAEFSDQPLGDDDIHGRSDQGRFDAELDESRYCGGG